MRRRVVGVLAVGVLAAVASVAAPAPGPATPTAAANTVTCPPAPAGLVTSVAPVQQRNVSLTFDDGPSARWTGQVLDVLKRNNVKATFYVVGSSVRKHPALVRRIHAEGHFIGNHTNTHPRLTTLSAAQQGAEMDGLTAAVRAVVPGYRPCQLRPPYGEWNNDTIAQARARGMSVVRWSHDTDDWNAPARLDGPEQADIVARATAQTASASHAVVLMHDGTDGNYRQNTVASLDRIIASYKSRGYVFTDAAGRRSPTDPPPPAITPNPFKHVPSLPKVPGRRPAAQR